MEPKEENSGPKHLKGCPICECSDPELERELQAFAQLLLDIYIDKKQREGDQKNDGKLEK